MVAVIIETAMIAEFVDVTPERQSLAGQRVAIFAIFLSVLIPMWRLNTEKLTSEMSALSSFTDSSSMLRPLCTAVRSTQQTSAQEVSPWQQQHTLLLVSHL